MLGTIRSTIVTLAVTFAAPAWAGDIVLTVSGKVAAPNMGDAWTFDMQALQGLPSERFETATIWTEGAQSFEGVSLEALLDHVGASGETIRATALNDYSVAIPVSDAVTGGPIVAYKRDGAEMSVRDKGPLWIIYPFDDNHAYRSEEYYSRSIWQLDRIEITTAE